MKNSSRTYILGFSAFVALVRTGGMVKNSFITSSGVFSYIYIYIYIFFVFFGNQCLRTCISSLDEIMSIFGFLALRFTGYTKNRPDPASFSQFRG